jgi:rifampicin phosphotransferase
MLGDKWITDRTPTERFPAYTRSNAGEVLADPVSPLGWTFMWESGVVLGCRDGFVSFGVFDADEYGTPPESFGLFGGYFYNSLMQARLMGVRMPGATPEAIDKAYFDNRPDVPPYVAEPWHESPRHSEVLGGTLGYVMTTDKYDKVENEKLVAKACRDSRPTLSKMTNAQLVGRARSMQPHSVEMFDSHVWVSLGASFGPSILQAILEPMGRSEDAVKLITGIGGVDSADIGRDLWKLSRLVRNSASLTAAFDAGLDDLRTRAAAADGGAAFLAELDTFVYNHGGRGPNEWDMAALSYESEPGAALAQIDALRRQDDAASPELAFTRNAAERQRIATEIGALLADNPEAAGTFAAGVHAAEVWMASRERCKGNNIRVIHEARMCFRELGRRMAEAGHIVDIDQIFMLTEDEVDPFLANPASFTKLLAEREVDFRQLIDLEPPFIVNGSCPPVSVGTVLTGAACAAGIATGRARVLTDPYDGGRLEPGDILITYSTDPSWTPLFLAAGAVITDIGAVGSHASIVSRELGIPCVASVQDATRRIPDGTMLTVDGQGTVTVVSLP